MKLFTPRFFSLAASALLATFAFADPTAPCALPGATLGSPDPLIGQWAFHWEATNYLPVGSAAIGTFEVRRDPGGCLGVVGNMTVNAGDRLIRFTSSGPYIIPGGFRRGGSEAAQYEAPVGGVIQGGVLQLAEGSQATSWQFIFKDRSQSEMFLVNQDYIDNIFLAHTLKGNAVRFNSANQLATCTNNGGVANILAASTPFWTMQTQSAVFDNNNGTSSIGDLKFGNFGRGFGVTAVVTTNTGSPTQFGGSPSGVTRLATTSGSVVPYACTNIAGNPSTPGNGFSMSLLIGPYATEYEAVFSNDAMTSAFLLSLNTTAQGPGQNSNLYKTDIFNGTLTAW